MIFFCWSTYLFFSISETETAFFCFPLLGDVLSFFSTASVIFYSVIFFFKSSFCLLFYRFLNRFVWFCFVYFFIARLLILPGPPSSWLLFWCLLNKPILLFGPVAVFSVMFSNIFFVMIVSRFAWPDSLSSFSSSLLSSLSLSSLLALSSSSSSSPSTSFSSSSSSWELFSCSSVSLCSSCSSSSMSSSASRP